MLLKQMLEIINIFLSAHSLGDPVAWLFGFIALVLWKQHMLWQMKVKEQIPLSHSQEVKDSKRKKLGSHYSL